LAPGSLLAWNICIVVLLSIYRLNPQRLMAPFLLSSIKWFLRRKHFVDLIDRMAIEMVLRSKTE
jgi:hypothetical protein